MAKGSEEKNKSQEKKDVKSESLNASIDYLYDLESHDWLNKNLNAKEKLFVFYVVSTNGINLSECARKAGYKSQANKIASRKNLELKDEIHHLKSKLAKIDIEAAYAEIVSQQIYAATKFDPTEAYAMHTEQMEDGRLYTHTIPCIPEEMKPEVRKMIKSIHFNARGIPEYEFFDRSEAVKYITALRKELNGIKTDSDDFDIETTAELIKDKMVVQTKVIRKNKEVADSISFKENPENITEEE